MDGLQKASLSELRKYENSTNFSFDLLDREGDKLRKNHHSEEKKYFLDDTPQISLRRK